MNINKSVDPPPADAGGVVGCVGDPVALGAAVVTRGNRDNGGGGGAGVVAPNTKEL